MSETFVHFKPREQWPSGVEKEHLVDEMRESLSDLPGVRFNFSQPIKDNVEEAVSGVRGKVVLKVFGESLDTMRSTLQQALLVLKDVPGIVDLDLYRDTSVPELQIALDRQALAREGISVDAAQQVIETALAGRIVTQLWEGEKEVPIRVSLPPGEHDDSARVGDLQVQGVHGLVPLRDIASLNVAIGRASINRESNSRFMALKFNVEGRDMGSTIKEAMAVVQAKLPPPEGYFFVWGGEFENQKRAMGRLAVIVPISLLAVFALLYSALGSARAATSVLIIAPLALTGGIFAVAIGHVVLSVSAAIGFIALLGQVSLSGLLVLSAIDAQREAGLERMPAAIAGATQRFRALLMTTLLAILGLLPMVVSNGVGSETQRPFATVIVGGMFTTLFVALFILPLVYALIMPKQRVSTEEAEALEAI
jgi:heavy metal efflux system protein